jgi:hypothetical protein
LIRSFNLIINLITLKWHFLLILETVLKPKNANYFAIGTNLPHSLFYRAYFPWLQVSDENC